MHRPKDDPSRQPADLVKMAPHIAHALHYHIKPIGLYLDLLRGRLTEDRGSLEILEKIETELQAVDRRIHDMLHFSTHSTPRRTSLNLHSMVTDLFFSLTQTLSEHEIRAIVDIPEDLVVLADREMLQRAILNLILNALDATGQNGEIVVTSYLGQNLLELEVADTGPGLSEEAMQRSLEPFYTTKNSGIGLGLATVDHVARAHGGSVMVHNCPDGGAAYTLRIPQQAMEAAA